MIRSSCSLVPRPSTRAPARVDTVEDLGTRLVFMSGNSDNYVSYRMVCSGICCVGSLLLVFSYLFIGKLNGSPLRLGIGDRCRIVQEWIFPYWRLPPKNIYLPQVALYRALACDTLQK